MNIKLTDWKALDHLQTEEDMVAFLNACLEEGEARLIAEAIGHIARRHGLPELAKDVGVSAAELDVALSRKGKIDFRTFVAVVNALGLTLRVTPRESTTE